MPTARLPAPLSESTALTSLPVANSAHLEVATAAAVGALGHDIPIRTSHRQSALEQARLHSAHHLARRRAGFLEEAVPSLDVPSDNLVIGTEQPQAGDRLRIPPATQRQLATVSFTQPPWFNPAGDRFREKTREQTMLARRVADLGSLSSKAVGPGRPTAESDPGVPNQQPETGQKLQVFKCDGAMNTLGLGHLIYRHSLRPGL